MKFCERVIRAKIFSSIGIPTQRRDDDDGDFRRSKSRTHLPESQVKQEVKELDTESETSEEKGDAADEVCEIEERGEELKRREAERAAAGDVLASLANACGPKEPEQGGGLFLICEENVLPESPVPNNNNNQDNNDGRFLHLKEEEGRSLFEANA